jgi:LmbE family N-acetylglucosaminyl deacetylase
MPTQRLALPRGTGPCDLTTLALPDGLRLLVTAPHPDDFDAIGVTLRHLARRGHAITLAVMRTGSGVEPCYRPGLSLEQLADLREQEQRNSLRFFGLPEASATFLRLSNDSDDQPRDTPANFAALHALAAAAQPDIIFLPHGNDTNQGHRAVYALARRIAERLPQRPSLLLNRDPKTIALRVDLYLPFGEAEAGWKGELLRFHDSQQQRNLHARGAGFDARILDDNRKAARELGIGAPYAETFEVEP